jgi:hypothetical protein
MSLQDHTTHRIHPTGDTGKAIDHVEVILNCKADLIQAVMR